MKGRSRATGGGILGLVLLAASACGGGGGDDPQPTPTPEETGRFTVQLLLAAAPDPLQNLDLYRAIVLDANGDEIFNEDFSRDETVQVLGLQPQADVTFVLQGIQGSNTVVSAGNTLPFDLTETFGTTVGLYFAQIDTFSDINGTPEVRDQPAVVTLSDGKALIAGGRVGGVATTSAEIYDPVTDTTTATPAMNAPHAAATAVLIDTNVVLVAGGVDDAENPTSAAEVFVYDPGTSTGTWETVPALTTARTDAGIVGLGSGHGLVAGGFDGGGNPLNTTEVFEWDGANGAWIPGPVLTVERGAPAAFAGAAGQAFIAGGYTGGGGANAYTDTVDFYAYAGGGGTINSGGSISSRRGYMGVTRLADGSVLLLGGREGNMDTTVATTERLMINGNQVTSAGGNDLPSARTHASGGVLADGRVLILGGLSGALPGTVIDDALVYDPGTGNFASFGPSPGPTVGGAVVPLADGTSLVVVDDRVTRYNP